MLIKTLTYTVTVKRLYICIEKYLKGLTEIMLVVPG